VFIDKLKMNNKLLLAIGQQKNKKLGQESGIVSPAPVFGILWPIQGLAIVPVYIRRCVY
jgi:hypothetical protein